MNLTVYLCEDRKDWDNFLEQCTPPTFLQSWEWHLFHAAQGYQTFPLLVKNEGTACALALVIKIQAKRGTHLLCAHGPILSGEENKTEILRVLTSHLEAVGRAEGCDFLRVCPLLADGQATAELFGSMGYRPAPIHHAPERAWILSLDPSEDTLLKEMRKATRYTINRTEKDEITVVKSDRLQDLDRFWSVYKETADRQHFTPFSKHYLQNEFETFAKSGKACFFFGVHHGKTISTAMILFSSHSAFYHHGASSHGDAKVNASCAVQWEAIREAKRRGCTQYNFWGIAPPNQPKHPWTGLSLFKTGFGGRAEDYLHAQDKPLTKKYWLNFVIETIRARKRGFRYR